MEERQKNLFETKEQVNGNTPVNNTVNTGINDNIAKEATNIPETPVAEKVTSADFDPMAGAVDLTEEESSFGNYFPIPVAEKIGETSPVGEVVKYVEVAPCAANNFNKYTHDGQESNKGLKLKDGSVLNAKYLYLKLEGSEDVKEFRISTFESLYKFESLRRYLSMNNRTLKGQKIKFKRIAAGKKTAGKNFEWYVPSINAKVIPHFNQDKMKLEQVVVPLN